MMIGRAALVACCLTVAALGLAATEPGAPPGPDAAPQQSADPPPGEMLIASAQIGDPRFHHAVVLLVRHDKDGAFGIVINHPLAEETIAKLLEATGDDAGGVEGSVRVFLGGPVQPELGFLIHTADYRRAETMDVDGKVAMTGSKDALRDIAQHKGPQKYLFALGYTGWGPGQLEAEIARNDWFTVPEDAALVFDEDRNAVWDKALARRGRDL
ncbi:MAG TPA: YqgE/AlgH family protein [Stellaceae bacterium]|nr:YqgE/AlgH family protein [Stellaceae bacterium]